MPAQLVYSFRSVNYFYFLFPFLHLPGRLHGCFLSLFFNWFSHEVFGSNAWWEYLACGNDDVWSENSWKVEFYQLFSFPKTERKAKYRRFVTFKRKVYVSIQNPLQWGANSQNPSPCFAHPLVSFLAFSPKFISYFSHFTCPFT